MNEKPPIGLVPRSAWEAQRMMDIADAIVRYREAGMESIPFEWYEEYVELEERQSQTPAGKQAAAAVRRFFTFKEEGK